MKLSVTIVIMSKTYFFYFFFFLINLPYIIHLTYYPRLDELNIMLIFKEDNRTDNILCMYFGTHELMGQCKRVVESRCHQELRKELLLVNMRLSVLK